MAFLTVNGIAVPVSADSASCKVERIGGDFARAPDGVGRLTHFRHKRRWKAKLPPQVRTSAIPHELLLAGRGYLWTFDSDLYDDGKGNYPTSSPVATLRTAESAPSYAAPDTYVTNPKHGTACVAVEEARTNILPENVRTGTDKDANTSGFTAIDGGTLSSSTAAAWQGSRSLRVDTNGLDATRDGVQTSPVSASGSTMYFGSVYLRAVSGTPSVRVYLRDNVGLSGTVRTATLSTSVWTRVECSLTTSPGATSIHLRIENSTATDAISFYADGLQIEQGAFATSWIAGAGATASRSAGHARYILRDLQSGTDATFMLWTRGSPGTVISSDQVLAALYGQSGISPDGPFFVVATLGSAPIYGTPGRLALLSKAKSGAVNVIEKANPWDGNWHHVAAVFRKTGGNRIELFYDGVSQGSATPADMPTFASTELGVGGFYDGVSIVANANGLIDDLVVLPFAAPASWIAAWFANGKYPAAPPRLSVSGDIVAGDTIACYGSVGEVSFRQFNDSGTWQNSGRSAEFELFEI